jgi:hypothetical protein
MTNFLARLVGRTLGTVPVVQPRIASMFDPDRGSRGAGDSGSRGEGEFFISNKPSENINSLTGETPIPQEFLEKSNDRSPISHQLTIPLAPGEIQREVDVGDELFNSIEVEDRGEFAKAATGISFQPKSTSFDSPEMQTKPKKSQLADGLSGDKVESTPMISNSLSVPSLRSDAGIGAASFDNNRATVISSPNQEDSRLHRNADSLTMGETIAAIPESPELKQKPPNPSSRKDEQIERLPITHYPSPIPNSQFPITPTIRVSIGRIEVRAIPAPPAPPAPRKSAPTPKLSLSEYLRKNGGGG